MKRKIIKERKFATNMNGQKAKERKVTNEDRRHDIERTTDIQSKKKDMNTQRKQGILKKRRRKETKKELQNMPQNI